jgi:hypothetical protein
MRPPRFRLRTLLVAVAVAAVMLGVIVPMVRLRARYSERAAGHGGSAQFYLEHARAADQGHGGCMKIGARGSIQEIKAAYRRVAPKYRRIADYHSLMARKYERASRYPWLPVPPDPPPPD